MKGRGKGKVTASVRRRILALHAAKKSMQAIATTLAGEGVAITKQGVHGVVLKDRSVAGKGKGAAGARGARTGRRGTGAARDGAAGVQGESAGTAEGTPSAESAPLKPIPNRTDALNEIHKLLTEPLPEQPKDAPLDLRLAFDELKLMRATLYAELAGGEYSLSQITASIKEMRGARAELRKLLPPAKPKPKDDPTNIAAREMLLDRIYMKVRTTEDRKRALGAGR